MFKQKKKTHLLENYRTDHGKVTESKDLVRNYNHELYAWTLDPRVPCPAGFTLTLASCLVIDLFCLTFHDPYPPVGSALLTGKVRNHTSEADLSFLHKITGF